MSLKTSLLMKKNPRNIHFQMFFHGNDMKKLHQYIPADYWPKNYGGNLPEIDYSGKEWYPATEKYNQYYIDWQKFGFK
jgi:retinaldehyde-binding protein 1